MWAGNVVCIQKTLSFWRAFSHTWQEPFCLLQQNTELLISVVACCLKKSSFPNSDRKLKSNGIKHIFAPINGFLKRFRFLHHSNLVVWCLIDCCASCFLFKYCFVSAAKGEGRITSLLVVRGSKIMCNAAGLPNQTFHNWFDYFLGKYVHVWSLNIKEHSG